MIFRETQLKGAYIIDLEKREDPRGFFARAWCMKEFEQHGLNAQVVQASLSFNRQKGTLRGMHCQVPPGEEAKLVRCTRGAIYDVIVDLKLESTTYRQWSGVELSSENYKMLYVPEGFAHGFLTLEDNTEVTYMVTEFYNPGAESGIRYNDPAFAITWPLQVQVISEKDSSWPDFEAVPSLKA